MASSLSLSLSLPPFSAYFPHHVSDLVHEMVPWKKKKKRHQKCHQFKYGVNHLFLLRHSIQKSNFVASANSGRHGDTAGNNGLQFSSDFPYDGSDQDIDFRKNVCLINLNLPQYILLFMKDLDSYACVCGWVGIDFLLVLQGMHATIVLLLRALPSFYLVCKVLLSHDHQVLV